MNPITQHHPASAQTPGPGREPPLSARRQRRRLCEGQHEQAVRAGDRGVGVA